MNTINIPNDCNKDNLIIACYDAARTQRERGHNATAKSSMRLAKWLESNNEYSKKDLALFAENEKA